jgi:uncharacterized protein (TIGR03083 family)
MALARAEREDLLDLLGTLAPEQWRAPSLCAGWSVHDVVAHVLSYEELGRGSWRHASPVARSASAASTPWACGSTPTARPPSSPTSCAGT